MPTPTDDLVAVLRGQLSLTLDPHFGVAINELLRLQAENQALRADAERYQFIRANSYVELFCDSPQVEGWKPEHFDVRVDLAIAALKDHP